MKKVHIQIIHCNNATLQHKCKIIKQRNKYIIYKNEKVQIATDNTLQQCNINTK